MRVSYFGRKEDAIEFEQFERNVRDRLSTQFVAGDRDAWTSEEAAVRSVDLAVAAETLAITLSNL